MLAYRLVFCSICRGYLTMVFVAESHFRRPDAPARIAHEGLHIDDCGVVVDDGFALGADVVAVLQNAAKHHAGRVIDA